MVLFYATFYVHTYYVIWRKDQLIEDKAVEFQTSAERFDVSHL